jgi:hypothetical protein
MSSNAKPKVKSPVAKDEESKAKAGDRPVTTAVAKAPQIEPNHVEGLAG